MLSRTYLVPWPSSPCSYIDARRPPLFGAALCDNKIRRAYLFFTCYIAVGRDEHAAPGNAAKSPSPLPWGSYGNRALVSGAWIQLAQAT